VHFSSERYFKQLRTPIKFLEHAFVVRRGKVGNRNLECRLVFSFYSHTFALYLASDSIHAPGALLNRGGIPAQVVMDNVTAFAVQVNALLTDRSGNEDLWPVRRVEPEEIPIAILCVAFYKLNYVAI
jgi:hypothetical protein